MRSERSSLAVATIVLVALCLLPLPLPAAPPDLLCAQGIERYQAGDLRGAVPLLRQALARARGGESAAAGHYLGLALIQLGQLAEGRRALAAASRAAPDDPRLLLDLGQAYLQEGNAAWAARVLERAAELAPKDGQVRYFHGVALLRLGEATSAAEELTRARALPGVDEADASLQLGLALYLDRRWEQSRLALGPALAGARGPAARQLLRAAHAAEGTPTSWISAELTAGMTVDSNPLYEHETTSPPAVGPSVAGSLTLRPWVSARNLLWGELAAARSFYFPAGAQPADQQVGARDASPTELRAAAFYARRLGSEGTALQVSGGYSFGLLFLDGAPPLADAHHLFLEQHGGHLSLQRLEAGHTQLQLRYSLTRSTFADLARSNWGNEVGFEYAWTLLGERLRLLGAMTVRHESAQSPDYNTIAPGLSLGGSFLAPLGIICGLRVGYEYQNHLDSAGSTRWIDQRVDHNLAITAELGRALPHGLRLRAVYQRLQNFSTLTTYTYGRDLFTLGLSWSTP